MDILTFKDLLEDLLRELETPLSSLNQTAVTLNEARFSSYMANAANVLPEHRVFCGNVLAEVHSVYGYGRRDLMAKTCKYLIKLIEMQTTRTSSGSPQKLFAAASDKLAEATTAFKSEDYSGVIQCCNTAIELELKHGLHIPTTITKINTAKIIELCLSYKVGPQPYLSELRSHVVNLDNEIKHRGYNPSKTDSVKAIKATEEFLTEWQNSKLTISNEFQESIYRGV